MFYFVQETYTRKILLQVDANCCKSLWQTRAFLFVQVSSTSVTGITLNSFSQQCRRNSVCDSLNEILRSSVLQLAAHLAMLHSADEEWPIHGDRPLDVFKNVLAILSHKIKLMTLCVSFYNFLPICYLSAVWIRHWCRFICCSLLSTPTTCVKHILSEAAHLELPVLTSFTVKK